jgi:hypothetical protein
MRLRAVKSVAAFSDKACSTSSAELDAIPQLKATAKLGEFLETGFSQSF